MHVLKVAGPATLLAIAVAISSSAAAPAASGQGGGIVAPSPTVTGTILAATPTATVAPEITATATAGSQETATATPTWTPSSGVEPPPSSGVTNPPTITDVTSGLVNPLTIIVTGANFLPGAVVYLNGQALDTTLNSSTMLTATVPPGMDSGVYGFTVANPGFPPSVVLNFPLNFQTPETSLHVPVVVKRPPNDATSLFVQNVSQSFTNVTLRFIDLNGFSDPSWSRSLPVAPGESAIIDLATESTLPPGFDGSAVLQSPQPITAVVNRITSAAGVPAPADAAGVPDVRTSSGSFTLSPRAPVNQSTVPVAFGGYHGYQTTVHVQNTGPAPGDFTVTLYRTGFPSPVASVQRVIQPGAAARIRLGPESGVPPDFVGTAVVSSGNSTVRVASETVHFETGVVFTYSGFATGANVANVPLLFKNYNDWVSGAQVVNVSQVPVVVNASMLQRDAPITLGLGPRTLAPNESFTYYLPAIQELPEGFVGSGVFTASGPIAVVVQQLNSARGAGMAYTGFSGGTPNVSVPVVFKGSAGWDSGVQVQNLGQGDALVDITYHLPGGVTVADRALIAAGSSTTFYQEEHPGLPPGIIGAAQVTSVGGAPIVAIVNEVNYERSGDASMSYEGVNY